MRKYGFWNAIMDFCLFFMTGGLWLIWIIAREIMYARK